MLPIALAKSGILCSRSSEPAESQPNTVLHPGFAAGANPLIASHQARSVCAVERRSCERPQQGVMESRVRRRSGEMEGETHDTASTASFSIPAKLRTSTSFKPPNLFFVSVLHLPQPDAPGHLKASPSTFLTATKSLSEPLEIFKLTGITIRLRTPAAIALPNLVPGSTTENSAERSLIRRTPSRRPHH